MNFIEAIQSCFKKFADFKGRASKSEFWFFLLFEFIYSSYKDIDTVSDAGYITEEE